MTIKFIGSTNSYMTQTYKDLVGQITVNGGIAYITSQEFRDSSFRTSLIDTIESKNDILTIKTLNSIYEFEILEGSIEDMNLTSMSEYRNKFDTFKANKIQESKVFMCQISGNPLIDNAISICELPHTMTLIEAREYCQNNVIVDINGDIVKHILSCYKKE